MSLWGNALMFITLAVAALNTQLSNVFDIIGLP